MDFLTLRREIIRKYFSKMNDRQLEAVTRVNGPLLVLAGAGSGKTTVLVNRILNIVKFGDAFRSGFVPEYTPAVLKLGEDYLNGIESDIPESVFSVEPCKPWQILAITFTNKAAGELKERIAASLGEEAMDVWAGTFHSVCGKILRRYAENLGYTSDFTIYDTDDQRKLVKEIMKQNNFDEKFVPVKSALAAISSAKDELISPEEYANGIPSSDFRKRLVAEIYKIYQKSLIKNNAMDFDDMIVNTVKLLRDFPDVRDYYSKKFKYIMVDEYQDTNHAQYVLVSLLSSYWKNLCVVGDDDQSIYRFRGATIENILNFEDEFQDAVTVRLEQNYRSTTKILNAANSVIANNKGRKGKKLWTDNGEGTPITVFTAEDERAEARFVADSILENVRAGQKFSDHAVLYRMNAQSNAIENVFARSGISYKVIGGTKFYDRKEIKDMLSYLQVINNRNDDLRLKRIINEPKRGIGATTVDRASEIAGSLGVSLFEVFKNAEEYPLLERSKQKLSSFCDIIDELVLFSEEHTITELYDELLKKSGYEIALKNDGEEGLERLENVKELGSSIALFELESDEPTLSAFLEEIALISDIDGYEENADKTVMMTVHSAKGLEFNNVYLVGMEEGIFPGSQSIYSGIEEIEEERRLAYVAITRAKKNLTVTNAYTRMLFGSTSRNLPSRFLKEIPEELCEFAGMKNSFSFTPSATAVKKPSLSVTYKPAQKESVNLSQYKVGQSVVHNTFGRGIIVSVTAMANDALLEIAFDTVGTKKIMAGFAKLRFE